MVRDVCSVAFTEKPRYNNEYLVSYITGYSYRYTKAETYTGYAVSLLFAVCLVFSEVGECVPRPLQAVTNADNAGGRGSRGPGLSLSLPSGLLTFLSAALTSSDTGHTVRIRCAVRWCIYRVYDSPRILDQ